MGVLKYGSVGFTGTREGMTTHQEERFTRYLKMIRPKYFHHGDCVGSDEQAYFIARVLGCMIITHPPDSVKYRAYCGQENIGDGSGVPIFDNIYVMPEKPYLKRNKDIVSSSDIMLATPLTRKEHVRSGTWSTIRYARNKCKPLVIIEPGGKSIMNN